MNRQRTCSGRRNSYRQDLSFDVRQFLDDRRQTEPFVSWLDLCWGTGRAVVEAASYFAGQTDSPSRVEIIGVDLVEMFVSVPPPLESIALHAVAAEDFDTSAKFDLITCVHGLHYIGDKLALIQKAVSWLKPEGLFLANLDLSNLRLADKPRGTNRDFAVILRQSGFSYNARKHLLTGTTQAATFPASLKYLGADDAAGANYTGQSAVNSYYRAREN